MSVGQTTEVHHIKQASDSTSDVDNTSLLARIKSAVEYLFMAGACLAIYTINPLYFIGSVAFGLSYPEKVQRVVKRIKLIVNTFPVWTCVAVMFALKVTDKPIIHFFASLLIGGIVGKWLNDLVEKDPKKSTSHV